MAYNPNIHHRRSIRLKGYDYGQAGLYFITICCADRICRFGHVKQGKMILNHYGEVAHNEWLKTPEIRSNVELGEFVIMPNHMHGIIRLLPRRGESHSPQTGNESHSTQTGNESHSPQTGSESHSPQTGNESHSPQTNSESHVPKTVNVLMAPGLFGELNSPDNGGVCKTPQRSPSQTIGAIVRGYKSAVTKQLKLLGLTDTLWQRNYYDNIIRNELSYQTISQYIIKNPEKWEKDRFYA